MTTVTRGMFRKKPVEVEAMLLTRWTYDDAMWFTTEANSAIVYDPTGRAVGITIHTLEGTMTANEGDWIIRGVKGEFYPCKPDIFEATYELVGEAIS